MDGAYGVNDAYTVHDEYVSDLYYDADDDEHMTHDDADDASDDD